MRVLKVNSKVQLNSGKVVKIPYLKAFVMEVKTDNTGTSNDNQFTIPTFGSGYDYTVLRCDESGNVLQRLENQTGDVTLTWVVAGTYIVKIVPKSDGTGFPRIFFNNGGDKLKLLDWQQVGTVAWTSMVGAFYGCSNMTGSFTDIPDLSGVSSMIAMFWSATAFNQDISGWNVSNVTSMRLLFRQATAFNQDISGWNVSNVTSMRLLFRQATAFNQDISGWDVSNVTSMRLLFRQATAFNQDISGWDVSNVTDMLQMFRQAIAFNQPIGNWNVSKVTVMNAILNGATAFNQPIGSWDVGNVTVMNAMLASATAFKQDISNWDIANVADFTNFLVSVDINNPDSTTNQDNYNALLVGWATRPTYSITKLESDGVNTKATAAGHGLVVGNTITITDSTNYDGVHEVLSVDGDTFTFDTAFIADETGTVRKDLKSNLSFHGGNSKYSGAEATAARAFLISEYNWSITDGGLA